MGGVRMGGTAVLSLPGTLPFSQIEGTTAPNDADQTNVWIVTNGVGIRLTPYVDPTCTPIPCGDEMHSPTLSPDGQAVAYCDFNPDSPFGMAVWVVPSDGSATYPLTPLYEDANGYWMNHPYWHPDGTKIVFTDANPDGSYTNGVFGGQIREVTYPGAVETLLWTPDLQTPVQREEGFRPTYSPDGTKIAFFVYLRAGGGGTSSRQGLWVMDADGSNVTQLDGWVTAADPESGYLMSGPQLSWSHDSQWIAYVDRGFGGGPSTSGTFSVNKIQPDGSNKTVLVSGSGGTLGHMIGFNAWLDDDSAVIYTESATPGTSANWEIWTVQADGTSPTMIQSAANGVAGSQNFTAAYRDHRGAGRINWINQITPSNTKINTCLPDGTDLQTTYLATEAVVANGTGFQWL